MINAPQLSVFISSFVISWLVTSASFAQVVSVGGNPPTPDLKDVQDQLNAVSSHKPRRITDPMTEIQLSSQIIEIEQFEAHELPKVKSQLDATCLNLINEDKEINEVVQKRQKGSVSEKQFNRKKEILKAIQFCAYANSTYQNYGDVVFKRNNAYWAEIDSIADDVTASKDFYINRLNKMRSDSTSTG